LAIVLALNHQGFVAALDNGAGFGELEGGHAGRLLVVGCWLFVIGYWLLGVGGWGLGVIFSLLKQTLAISQGVHTKSELENPDS